MIVFLIWISNSSSDALHANSLLIETRSSLMLLVIPVPFPKMSAMGKMCSQF